MGQIKNIKLHIVTDIKHIITTDIKDKEDNGMNEETKDGGTSRVLRVTQLDAARLDASLFNIFQSELKSSLEIDESFSKLLRHLGPELNVILRYIIWRFSVSRNGVTVGQSLYNTMYISNGSSINRRTRILFGLLTISLPWLKERRDTLMRILKSMFAVLSIRHTSEGVENWFKYVDRSLKVISLVNFLILLLHGRRASPMEHALQLDHVFCNKPVPRYIDYAYMGKEMIWEQTAQALVCLIPFLNLRKIRNYTLKIFGCFRSDTEDLMCQVCYERATNPYCGICEHVFCYYCLRVNMEADSNYACPKCGSMIRTLIPYLSPSSASLRKD